jgi:hypothetical protein
LARVGFPKSFSGKIMLVVFAGTHLPLVVLVLYLLLASPGGLGTHLGVLAALLIAILLGFVATLFALRALLAPVRVASSSLEAYLDERRKPELPIGFSDEAGKLMADVQHALDYLDSTIRSLEGLSGTDHLTGLPNRRKGEERLAEDLARAKRGGASLTVALILVYIGSVVLLQALFRTVIGSKSQLAIVASTLAIAALFVPLRRRVQGFVDRRFIAGSTTPGRPWTPSPPSCVTRPTSTH